MGKPFVLFLNNESTMADTRSSAASVSSCAMQTLGIVLLSLPRSEDYDATVADGVAVSLRSAADGRSFHARRRGQSGFQTELRGGKGHR